MDYTEIPGLEKRVSRIGLGTRAIGGSMWGGTDLQESVRTIEAALRKGVTFIDTAPAYGQGFSERIVGKALEESGRRDEVILATRSGIDWRNDAVFRNADRDRIFREIEDSLGRLRTDHVDLYQVHWPDPDVPVEETARAMRELLEDGTIRAVGVSNFSVEQMERFREVAPLHACQFPYNLFERGAEEEILPYCREEGIASVTCSSLCRGLLSGTMGPDPDFGGDDLRQHDPKYQKPRYGRYRSATEALDALARARFGRSVLALAVRWILDRAGVTAALWGARHPRQLEPLDRVFGWSLDRAARNEVDRILHRTVGDPVGRSSVAPPARSDLE